VREKKGKGGEGNFLREGRTCTALPFKRKRRVSTTKEKEEDFRLTMELFRHRECPSRRRKQRCAVLCGHPAQRVVASFGIISEGKKEISLSGKTKGTGKGIKGNRARPPAEKKGSRSRRARENCHNHHIINQKKERINRTTYFSGRMGNLRRQPRT